MRRSQDEEYEPSAGAKVAALAVPLVAFAGTVSRCSAWRTAPGTSP